MWASRVRGVCLPGDEVPERNGNHRAHSRHPTAGQRSSTSEARFRAIEYRSLTLRLFRDSGEYLIGWNSIRVKQVNVVQEL